MKQVNGLRQIVEDMKETVAGLRVEDKGAETRTRERAGQKRGRRYVMGLRSWQPKHTRRTKRAHSPGKEICDNGTHSSSMENT